MSKLAVWSIGEQDGGNGAELLEPKQVGHSSIGLEKFLEDWIVKDVSLIGDGLTLVGRQVTIDDGRLDLLAIDSRDRWVVIEVKPGMLQSGALHQALYYASSLVRLDKNELYEKLKGNLASFGDQATLSARLEQHLNSEEEQREIALMLVGVGISAGVERMNEFLGRFGIPIEIVSFEVFKPDNGPQLLIREVIEEPAEPSTPKRKYTVEAIRERARAAGVGNQFDRFVRMSEQAGLPVQPQGASIKIAPPQDRRYILMYAGPHHDSKGGGLRIYWWASQFHKFFPKIDEHEVSEALGKEEDGGFVTGEELEQRLDQIQRFLATHFPRAEADDA